jgi:alpha-beta hydrolase superfamily lysophospholipase
MTVFDFDWTTSDELTLRGKGWMPAQPPRAVVALVHGFAEHVGRYAHVAEAFAQLGVALIGFDLRGHGRSDGRRGHSPSYSNYMEDLREFLSLVVEKLPDLPLYLYGHSAGGNLVLNYALRYTPDYVQGVIATSPWLRLAFQPPASKIWLAKVASILYPAFLEKSSLDPAHLSTDPEVGRAYAADPLVHDRISAGAFAGLVQGGERALREAGQWAKPLLLMHGAADQVTSFQASEQFAAGVPPEWVTFRPWPQGRHELHNELFRAEAIAAMTTWLTGQLGPS